MALRKRKPVNYAESTTETEAELSDLEDREKKQVSDTCTTYLYIYESTGKLNMSTKFSGRSEVTRKARLNMTERWQLNDNDIC
jgi:hypothetical protein